MFFRAHTFSFPFVLYESTTDDDDDDDNDDDDDKGDDNDDDDGMYIVHIDSDSDSWIYYCVVFVFSLTFSLSLFVLLYQPTTYQDDDDEDDDDNNNNKYYTYTRTLIDSFAHDGVPVACENWYERCLDAAQQVAVAAANNVSYLRSEYFDSELCSAKFSCQNRQQAWNVSTITYEPSVSVIGVDNNNNNNNNNNNKNNNNYLVLHLPGTGSKTIDQTDYTDTIASMGYYVISLSYSSYPIAVSQTDAYCMSLSLSSSASASASASHPSDTVQSDCNTKFHESVVFGIRYNTTTSTSINTTQRQRQQDDNNNNNNNVLLWPVPEEQSIEAIATDAIRTMGWTQFLTTTKTSSTIVDWTKVIVTGHSQGGSHAAYMSTRLPIPAAVLLSGPQEIVNATWMHRHRTCSSSASSNSTTQQQQQIRSMFAAHEDCGEEPVNTNSYCAVYGSGTNLPHGILYRNSEYMNMTYYNVSGIIGGSGSTDDDNNTNSTRYFFPQNYIPTDCDTDQRCYHNSNVYNYAPSGVKLLWYELFDGLM